MADKIEKFLRKLPARECSRAVCTIRDIYNRNTAHLHIKKLRGSKAMFRVRMGDIRIIFEEVDDEPVVIFVGKRSDINYKKLL